MSAYSELTETFQDIATAINNKGVSGSMTPSQMAAKIAQISTGSVNSVNGVSPVNGDVTLDNLITDSDGKVYAKTVNGSVVTKKQLQTTLEGQSFDISTEDKLYDSVKNLIQLLGGTVIECLLFILSFFFIFSSNSYAGVPSGFTGDYYTNKNSNVIWSRHGTLNTKKSYVVTDVTENEKKYAMFIIDVNVTNNSNFAGIELKASTNNFSNMLYFCPTTMNNMPIVVEGSISNDYCYLFVTDSRPTSRDVRSWTRVSTSTMAMDYPLDKLVIIVSPEKGMIRYKPNNTEWLSSNNDDLIWSYCLLGISSVESNVWYPVQPVKWLKELPKWVNE